MRRTSERRPASSLAMIPERGVGTRPRGHSDDLSVSPRSRVRSVSANPESSRNAINRGLLPDLDDSLSPVASPRKRSAAVARVHEIEPAVSSPSKRPNVGGGHPLPYPLPRIKAKYACSPSNHAISESRSLQVVLHRAGCIPEG